MKYSFRLVTPLTNKSTELTKLVGLKNSIFLAGPCPRTNFSDDWRFEAFEILNDLGFTGTVITPTNENYSRMTSEFGLSKMDALKAQTNWERIAMHLATAIVFWIPRSEKNPARTTNIELGEWYKKPGTWFGWPEGAIHNEYISLKLAEQSRVYFDDLRTLLNVVVDSIQRRTPVQWFTSDTHFSQQRTLELSRRPFVDVKEMDLTIISNWNKNVKPRDIVYHAGDFIDPDKISKLKSLLDNLNFGKLHWTLGNYDRKVVTEINNIVKNYDRPIFIYDINNLCRVATKNNKFVIVHEPTDNSYQIQPDEIVLFGHIHGRSFAKRNGFDLAADYHRYTPINEEQVDWFANAMKYWDENVFSDKVKIQS